MVYWTGHMRKNLHDKIKWQEKSCQGNCLMVPWGFKDYYAVHICIIAYGLYYLPVIHRMLIAKTYPYHTYPIAITCFSVLYIIVHQINIYVYFMLHLDNLTELLQVDPNSASLYAQIFLRAAHLAVTVLDIDFSFNIGESRS